MSELTTNEKKVLLFVDVFVKNNGWSPSVREIKEGVGLKSTCTVHSILKKLEKKGYILYKGVRQIKVLGA